ncbi:HIT zinc finger, partial [Ancylostoma duodenale]
MASDMDLCVNGGSSIAKEDDEVGSMEDGEIVDAEDQGFIPLAGVPAANGTADEITNDMSNSSDDEPPEEILNRVAKKKAEEAAPLMEKIDPKLCAMCQKVPHKYRCPKCDLRTCSVECSKQHKEVKKCDGVRPPFQPVSKLSQFDANKSIQDQRFLHAVQTNLKTSSLTASAPSTSKEQHSEMKCEGETSPSAVENENTLGSRDDGEENDGWYTLQGTAMLGAASSIRERYLIQNALRRRIWLSYSDVKGADMRFDICYECFDFVLTSVSEGEDNSRHEQFSDTIFWCVDLIFNKQLEDGSVSTYTYRVQNIPETIRLVTVLRQFLKPRQHGCIVSRSDLDLEKLAPFIEAGIEGVNGFMRVPNYEPERYYLVDLQKDLLHNTRNRLIVDHPKIIITLDTEFITSYCLISEAEAEEIREKQRQSRAMAQSTERGNGSDFPRSDSRGGRGGFRGGRGGPRGGFRGGFRGHNDYGAQRGRGGGSW